MKIALAQINTTVGDFVGNAEKIKAAIDRTRRSSCELVVFPEMAVSGYPPTDYVNKSDFIQKTVDALDDIAQAAPDIGVIVGYPDPDRDQGGSKGLYNAAALLHGGRVQVKAHKMLLPSYDVVDENRYFQPGSAHRACHFNGKRLGITIGEDLWDDKDLFADRPYPRDPVKALAEQGIDMLINLAASPFDMEKRRLRNENLQNIASAYSIPVIWVNQVGGNDSLVFDGAGMVIDAQGTVQARAYEFEEDIVIYDSDRNNGDIRPILESEEALAYKALVTGTRDYILKCGFDKAIIGLSGGVDSSLTACVAADALGSDSVWGIAMPSPYSSEASLEDAEQLAANLSIHFDTIPVSELYYTFQESLAPLFVGCEEDSTEENLQARIRGTLLMSLSNKFHALVLNTGNKSELAVGYCTLYGDMCGALAVISDIPKTMVYRICRYINRNREIVPNRVLTKPPSAELKPGQTDQDSLPPYDMLDRILSLYMDQSLSITHIVEQGFDRETVVDVVQRIHRNEHKRQQAPPGLKITTRTFGTGRRYPIAHKPNY
jgi:NAD+ synthetase